MSPAWHSGATRRAEQGASCSLNCPHLLLGAAPPPWPPSPSNISSYRGHTVAGPLHPEVWCHSALPKRGRDDVVLWSTSVATTSGLWRLWTSGGKGCLGPVAGRKEVVCSGRVQDVVGSRHPQLKARLSWEQESALRPTLARHHCQPHTHTHAAPGDTQQSSPSSGDVTLILIYF